MASRDTHPCNHRDRLPGEQFGAPQSRSWGSRPKAPSPVPTPFPLERGHLPPPTGSRRPGPTSALAAGAARAGPWGHGVGGGARALSRFTPRALLFPPPALRSAGIFQRSQQTNGGRGLRPPWRGSNWYFPLAGAARVVTVCRPSESVVVSPRRSLTVVSFFNIRVHAASSSRHPHGAACDGCRDVTAWLPWVRGGGAGGEPVVRACHGCPCLVPHLPAHTHAARGR